MKTIKRSNFRLLALAIMLVVGISAKAQLIVNTVAGNGFGAGTLSGGYSGDGGSAVGAEITQPTSVAFDHAGNMYVVDYFNAVVRKINTAGVISTFAGNGLLGYSGDGGPATAAKLDYPTIVTADAAGNIYIADNSNNVIRKVNTAGIISTFAGNGTGAGTSAGAYSGDGGPATAAGLFAPEGLAFDATGNLYVSDAGNYVIRKISTTGIITTIAGKDTAGYSGDGGPATAAKLYGGGLIFDPTGNLYIGDSRNNVVRKINTAGTISTIAGNGTGHGAGSGSYTGDGGLADTAGLFYPEDIAFDAAGNLLIADFGNNVIRKVNAAGVINTIAGNGYEAGSIFGGAYSGDGGLATHASFAGPSNLALGAHGKIYFSDQRNNVVRALSMNHVPTFTGGTSGISICENAPMLPIHTYFTAVDSDLQQTERWTVATPASHGTLAGFNTTVTTNGGATTPADSLYYTPAAGYSGADAFSIQVSDGIASATMAINVTVNPLPHAGVITGATSVCAGAIITLSDVAPGGIWSSGNDDAAIAGTGSVVGVSPGTDIINYTVINGCGSATATFTVTVLPPGECATLLRNVDPDYTGLKVYPNPSGGDLTVNLVSGVDEQVEIIITNVTGLKLQEFTATTNTETKMQVDLPSGVYFLNANTAHGQWHQKLTIIK